MKLSHALLVAALGCGLAATSALAGSEQVRASSYRSTPNAHLIVKRSPNIGYLTQFNIYVDGVRVASLGYGRKYEGAIPAGNHLVTIQHMPHLNDAYPYTQTWIHVVPGRPNVFTAKGREGGTRIVLEQS
jgi:hypothetical protein